MFYPLFSHFKNLRKILGQRAILQTNLFWGQLLRCSMVQKFTLKNYGISLLAVLLLKVVGNSVKDFFEVCFFFEAVKSAVVWIPGYENSCSEHG